MQSPSNYVPCIYCTRGPKGSDPNPCSGVSRIRSAKAGGCYLGQVIPGKEALHQGFIRRNFPDSGVANR